MITVVNRALFIYNLNNNLSNFVLWNVVYLEMFYAFLDIMWVLCISATLNLPRIRVSPHSSNYWPIVLFTLNIVKKMASIIASAYYSMKHVWRQYFLWYEKWIYARKSIQYRNTMKDFLRTTDPFRVSYNCLAIRGCMNYILINQNICLRIVLQIARRFL